MAVWATSENERDARRRAGVRVAWGRRRRGFEAGEGGFAGGRVRREIMRRSAGAGAAWGRCFCGDRTYGRLGGEAVARRALWRSGGGAWEGGLSRADQCGFNRRPGR